MPRAERDPEAIFRYIRDTLSPPAEEWFEELVASIEGLAEHPSRRPRTHEDPTLHQLLFGNKPHIYRIIYQIDQQKQQVNLLHVRHHSRRAFSGKAISNPRSKPNSPPKRTPRGIPSIETSSKSSPPVPKRWNGASSTRPATPAKASARSRTASSSQSLELAELQLLLSGTSGRYHVKPAPPRTSAGTPYVIPSAHS